MIRNHLNSRICTVSAVLLIATFIFGCNKQEPAPAVVAPAAVPSAQKVAKPVQKTASSAIRLVPQVSGVQFDFSSKKDPFKPFATVKPVSTASPDDLKKALKDGLPIHSFDVSQFRLIGIVTGGRENQAMVVDPTGKGYVLKAGMSIGKNDGKVISVNTGGVEVLEQFKDDNGRVRRENIRITLPRKQ